MVSVLFFDTPALATTDPPAIAANRALSAMPGDKQAPDSVSVPTASIGDGSLKNAGTTGDAVPTEGVAQAQP